MTVTHKEAKQAETVSVEAVVGNITHAMGVLRMTLAQKQAKQAETVSVEAHQHHAFNIMHSTSYAYKQQTPRSAKVGGA